MTLVGNDAYSVPACALPAGLEFLFGDPNVAFVACTNFAREIVPHRVTPGLPIGPEPSVPTFPLPADLPLRRYPRMVRRRPVARYASTLVRSLLPATHQDHEPGEERDEAAQRMVGATVWAIGCRVRGMSTGQHTGC